MGQHNPSRLLKKEFKMYMLLSLPLFPLLLLLCIVIPVVLGKILNSCIEDNYVCEGVDLLFVSFLLRLLSSNLLIC